MRTLRYTNAILTVLAVLLTLNLYVTFNTSVDRGVVASLDMAQPAYAQGGIPNPGAQRQEMVDLLKQQLQKMDGLSSLLKSGEARVKVEVIGGEERPAQ